MRKEHIMFLINMTLEKTPMGKTSLEIDVYIRRSQSMSIVIAQFVVGSKER
jgi:hypothetical protein